MDNQLVYATVATSCGIIAFLLGRVTRPSTFNPFAYYRARVKQIVESADTQSNLQAELRKFNEAYDILFPDTKK